MSIDEQPSVKHMKTQMNGMRYILKFNKMLRFIGLGSKKLAGMEEKLGEMSSQMKDLTEYPARFNALFSDDGWLAHDSMNFDTLKNIVDTCENQGKDEATRLLMDFYSPDAISDRMFFLNGVEELRIRRKFIDYALDDYKAGRHYSAAPLLLMVIDGAVNDAVGTGFHSQSLDLDVWDSLTAADGAIEKIKGIFQRARKKTRTEEIHLPYRHGILHGMDLGYDNAVVTAKCWCVLFVVKDWIAAKKSEDGREEAFKGETRIPSIRELASQMRGTEALKQSIRDWKERAIEQSYIDDLNAGTPADPVTPEHVAVRLMELWQRKNYGHMAKLFWRKIQDSSKQFPKEVREMHGWMEVVGSQVLRIVDEAPAIAEVMFAVSTTDGTAKPYTVRLIREDDSGSPVPAGTVGGTWQVVHITPTRDAEPGNG